ncbi:MAG: sulfite exporter TauE/SafE family protein, partial [Pseudomonadota bacterium]
IVSVLLTSALSGLLGMAGGMILMAILISLLPVAVTMLLHGVVQATSNGSRAWFLRRYINWSILRIYLIGAVAALALFSALTLIPSPGLVLILVGSFAWLARFSKQLRGLDITQPRTAISCGFVVTAAQLLAGASGPLLDVFYLNTPLNRQQIVANKAVTQTLGHLLKIFYYGLLLNLLADNAPGGEVQDPTTALPLWVYAACVAMAIVGARLGTRLLERWNDNAFQRISQIIILATATFCIVQGAYLMLFA